MKLSQFKALTFDVYGTLIDWESGMIAGLKPLTDRVSRSLTRNEILEAHAHYESSTQRWTPAKLYRDLLPVVYRRLAEEWGVPASWAECEAYGRSVADWPAFPDSVEALGYLKDHFRLVILSNVDNASFAASNERLGVTFDAIYTAQDVGAYKPSDRNFEYMLAKLAGLGVEASGILHTAESMFHDHAPANYGWAFAIGITLNLGFVIVEAGYGFWANSLALLADAGHNLSDVLGLLLAWGGYALSKLAPSPNRTYGWRGSTILAALFNALLLLLAIGGIAWEAIGRLAHPAPGRSRSPAAPPVPASR